MANDDEFDSMFRQLQLLRRDKKLAQASVRPSFRPSKRIPTYVPPVPTATYVHGRYVEFWRSDSSKST
eukprot:scaffold10356_cov131-Skeletonema_dohrnii-CCMP3373.AAC.2